MKPTVRGRRTMITDEPQRIASELMGRPLGSVRRRFAALVVDSVLFWVVTFSFFVGMSLYSFHAQDPTFLGKVRTAFADRDQQQGQDVFMDFLVLVIDRRPDVLSAELRELLNSGRRDAFSERFLEAAWHPNRQALHDKISGTVVIRTAGRP